MEKARKRLALSTNCDPPQGTITHIRLTALFVATFARTWGAGRFSWLRSPERGAPRHNHEIAACWHGRSEFPRFRGHQRGRATSRQAHVLANVATKGYLTIAGLGVDVYDPIRRSF